MCRERIVDRVPSAVSIGIGRLSQHRFALHKRGVDGSAKADAFYTGDERDEIWGVVLQIDPQHKADLDRFESVGVGYEAVMTTVQMSNGKTFDAWTYRALTIAIEKDLQPFCWYRRFILHGARQHGLPADYERFLAAFAAVTDPDPVRRRGNERILE